MFLVKGQVYSQIVNMLDEIKTLIIAANACVIEGLLQLVWQEVEYAEVQMSFVVMCFAHTSNKFYTSVC
jgi:hypothetical protein